MNISLRARRNAYTIALVLVGATRENAAKAAEFCVLDNVSLFEKHIAAYRCAGVPMADVAKAIRSVKEACDAA